MENSAYAYDVSFPAENLAYAYEVSFPAENSEGDQHERIEINNIQNFFTQNAIYVILVLLVVGIALYDPNFLWRSDAS